jgi:hypothetical protein
VFELGPAFWAWQQWWKEDWKRYGSWLTCFVEEQAEVWRGLQPGSDWDPGCGAR